jgi:hypothetical protein
MGKNHLPIVLLTVLIGLEAGPSEAQQSWVRAFEVRFQGRPNGKAWIRWEQRDDNRLDVVYQKWTVTPASTLWTASEQLLQSDNHFPLVWKFWNRNGPLSFRSEARLYANTMVVKKWEREGKERDYLWVVPTGSPLFAGHPSDLVVLLAWYDRKLGGTQRILAVNPGNGQQIPIEVTRVVREDSTAWPPGTADRYEIQVPPSGRYRIDLDAEGRPERIVDLLADMVHQAVEDSSSPPPLPSAP